MTKRKVIFSRFTFEIINENIFEVAIISNYHHMNIRNIANAESIRIYRGNFSNNLRCIIQHMFLSGDRPSCCGPVRCMQWLRACFRSSKRVWCLFWFFQREHQGIMFSAKGSFAMICRDIYIISQPTSILGCYDLIFK